MTRKNNKSKQVVTVFVDAIEHGGEDYFWIEIGGRRLSIPRTQLFSVIHEGGGISIQIPQWLAIDRGIEGYIDDGVML